MHNGESTRTTRRALLIAALALTAGAALTGCANDTSTATGPSAEAVNEFFGPDGYGKLRITMTETEALATGDLGAAPVSTAEGENRYSFAGGPAADAKQIAQDEQIEKDVRTTAAAAKKANDKADEFEKTKSSSLADVVKSADLSAKGAAASAEASKAIALSTQRMLKRLEAFLDAGGAAFADGRITTIAAPAGASTAAGIKRGSTAAELKAAYQDLQPKSATRSELQAESITRYELPVAGQPGWWLTFDLEADQVKYLMLRLDRP